MATASPEPLPRSVLLCVLLLASAIAGTCVAQAPAAWSVEQYTADNGLPQNSVRSMAFDTSGHLWLTTEGGLVRFDGLRFRTWNAANTPQLVDDRMGNLLRDHAGRLFASDASGSFYRITGTGPGRVEDGRTFPESYYLLSGVIPDAALYRSIVRIEAEHDPAGHWSHWDLQVHCHSARSWSMFGQDGLFLFNGKGQYRYLPMPPATRHASYMHQDQLHLIDKQHQWSRVDLGTGIRVPLTLVRGPDPGAIQRIFWTPGNDVLLALADGVLWQVLHPGNDQVLLEPLVDHLPQSTRINAVLCSQDRSTILIGTSSQGLFRYSRQHFSTVRDPLDNGELHGNSFYAMVALDDSTVLTTSRWTLQGGTFTPPDKASFPLDEHVLHRDAKGRIWGGSRGGVVIFGVPNDSLLGRSTKAGLPCAILEEGDTVRVVGTKGLAAFVDDSVRSFVPLNYTKYRDRPNALVRTAQGELWYASGRGLFRMDPNAGGATVVPGTQGWNARALHRHGDHLLVGTYGQGAFVVQGERIVPLPFQDVPELTHVHAFAPDRLGNIWMPTNRGLFRMRSADLDRYLLDTTARVPHRFHGMRDGIGTLEFNGGCSPAYVYLLNGQMVLPTIDGIVYFEPASIPVEEPPVRAHVDAVQLNGVAVPLAGGVKVQGWGSRIEVDVSIPFWGDPRNLRAFYRFGGPGSVWHPVPANGHIVLERLFAGTYKLQFMGNGLHDATVQDLLSITVVAPWYARWWAILLGMLLLVGSGIALQRRRVLRLQRINALLEHMVEHRTAELRRSNAAIQNEAQVKDRLVRIFSHDVVAPLKAIARVGRIGMEQGGAWTDAEMRTAFREMASASGQLHDNASNLLQWIKHQGGSIVVRQEHVALHDFVARVLVSLAPAAAQQAVVLVNEVPEEELVITDPDLLGIILQNLVSNAVKHAPGAAVRITAESTGNGWRIAVADQGPGIPATALQRIRSLLAGEARSTELRTGLGFVIIADMAELLGAQILVHSTPGAGTVVNVEWSSLIGGKS